MIFIKRVQTARERAVRSLFSQAGINSIQDELTGEAGDESRFLFYPLPILAEQASGLIQQLLQKGYGIDYNTELEITYREKNAA